MGRPAMMTAEEFMSQDFPYKPSIYCEFVPENLTIQIFEKEGYDG